MRVGDDCGVEQLSQKKEKDERAKFGREQEFLAVIFS